MQVLSALCTFTHNVSRPLSCYRGEKQRSSSASTLTAQLQESHRLLVSAAAALLPAFCCQIGGPSVRCCAWPAPPSHRLRRGCDPLLACPGWLTVQAASRLDFPRATPHRCITLHHIRLGRDSTYPLIGNLFSRDGLVCF